MGYLRDPDMVPVFVSNYQARSALIAAGMFTAVQSAIVGLGTSSPEYQAWEYANNFYRNSPLIASMALALELTGEQVDDLFRAAAQVT